LNRIPYPLPALALAAALLATSCAKPTSGTDSAANAALPPEAVRTLTATSADVPLEFAAIGNVEAISTVDVKSRVTAPILRVHFAEGQDVKQGDYLFELDPETFNRQIAEAEANIAKDSANEKQAEANILRDDATRRNLEAIAKRSAQLNRDGILSSEQNAQAQSNADAAKASVDADRAARDSAQAAAKADRAKLEQIRLQLDFTKIRAPISGRAGAIAVKQGNLAKENDNTLVTLLQTAPVYVSFPVPENLLPEVRKYNAAHPLEITATTADSKSATGSLQFIDNTVDATTGTIRLKASFANADRALWPGQFVNVSARLAVERDRILVASRALQTGPNGKYVWVLNAADSTVSMREVAVLRLFTPPGQPETAVIGSGLKPGEAVVSEGQMRLAPNAKVRVLTTASSGN
jgi:multidrug efflux system membrane fusion protein